MGYQPIAYVTEHGDLLCRDHDEPDAHPIMEWDEPLDILQECPEHGTFCGSCGLAGWVDVVHERATSRQWECGNCRAEVRFLSDGRGFQRWGAGAGEWVYMEGTG